uniref:G-protein coupled receptors family 2 profile 2 domain-containing protein n=1 Tax=Octactis speculum TaxID=3111310 RepID=A0A7S2F7C4_9STRA|mmetsp:Transcript_14989/g.20033  ORF Transcript_14989/g.20033 Transcript_14989/m.20033 type:complete len:373 (+) Transcript_14989:33-1151(+)
MSADSGSFSSEQERMLLKAAIYCSTVSCFGSLVVIASYVRFPHLRGFSFMLVAYLAVADLGTDVVYFLGDYNTGDNICTLQAVMRVYFNLAAIFLTVVIAHLMHAVIVDRNFDVEHEQRKLPTYIIFSWGLPAIFAALPFTTGNYGNNGAWCSITPGTGSYWAGVMWIFVCIFVPCWLAIGYNVTVYLTVNRVVRGLHMSHSMSEMDEYSRRTHLKQRANQNQFVERLQLYPLVLVVSWTWVTIYCFQAMLEPDQHIFWLAWIGYSMCSLMGFLNACVYVATPSVWRAWTGGHKDDVIGCGLMTEYCGGLCELQRSSFSSWGRSSTSSWETDMKEAETRRSSDVITEKEAAEDTKLLDSRNERQPPHHVFKN